MFKRLSVKNKKKKTPVKHVRFFNRVLQESHESSD